MQVKLILYSTVTVNHVIPIEVEGGGRTFIIVKAQSEKSVFGVDVSELELVEDDGTLE